jgi:hypothetical protein
MFKTLVLDYQTNLFQDLSESVEFENITKGRKGANLVDDQEGLIPIVRTTSIYEKPVQRFLPIHRDIVKNIRNASGLDLDFNNAMIELYDSSYRKMKFHTEQALDLDPNSYIGIFSCYENPAVDIRTLKIQDKTTGECSEISMGHNSVVLFSVETNQKFIHKIVLDTAKPVGNRWLGITYRLSKTFIQFRDEIPYFYRTDKVLRMASQDERREFYKHKSNENSCVGYVYPEIQYTISMSDMLPII